MTLYTNQALGRLECRQFPNSSEKEPVISAQPGWDFWAPGFRQASAAARLA
jgi:hypothetical protein